MTKFKTVSARGDKRSQPMVHGVPPPPVSQTTSTPTPFSFQELRDIGIQISASWFRAPEATRLTLMEVHPWRLHAYWNIAEADMAAALRSLPANTEERALVLRFTDLSPQRGGITPDYSFDIEVQGLRNNWYVDLWQDGRRYSAQLGLRTTDGDIISLARSNEAALPRAAPSSELDFKQIEVRTPLPMDLDLPETAPGHSMHLLKNLFPRGRPLAEKFPELEPEAPDITLDEPECAALMCAAAEPADGPAFRQPEQELIDYSHAAPVPILTEETEFPRIDSAEIDPFRIQAKKEKARLLAEIGMEMPPVAEETISSAEVDLAPRPLPVSKGEPGLPRGTSYSETVLESSAQLVDLDTSEAQPQGLDAVPHLSQGGFPEVMPDRDTDFAEPELSLLIADNGAWQGHPAPFEPRGEEAMAPNTPPADGFTAEGAVPEQTITVPGPAPGPVIALEGMLGNTFFSYGHGDSAPEINAELHLHGKLGAGSVLSLFGEQLHLDPQGNFSVRLKLDSGPALSALLYGQRNRTEDRS